MPADKENKEVRDPVALELFKSIGLDAKTAANAVANPKVTANLTDVVHEVCFSSRRLPFRGPILRVREFLCGFRGREGTGFWPVFCLTRVRNFEDEEATFPLEVFSCVFVVEISYQF
jgi:hypothetical protein